MKFCIALTGTIASGKSTVAQFFSKLGIDIIYADHISRELTEKDTFAYQKIVKHFSTLILDKEECINRNQLRQIIFANSNEKKWLENLLHPLIRNEIKNQVVNTTSDYCMIEIPLLVDKTNYPYINRILLINALQSIQVARIKQRDSCSERDALAIIVAQPNLDLRIDNADDIISNNGDLTALQNTVLDLHHKYLFACKKKTLEIASTILVI